MQVNLRSTNQERWFLWECQGHRGVVLLPKDTSHGFHIEWEFDDIPNNWEEIERAIQQAHYPEREMAPSDAGAEKGKKLLSEFCDVIDNAGGLTDDEEGSGLPAPVGSPSWIDLAGVYENACADLGRSPVWLEADHA